LSTVSIAAEYLETQVFTASPYRLHLMVIDAALRHARQGLEALNSGRWEMLDRSLSRCRDCVSELVGGLRPEAAPELIEPMRELFLFVYRSIAMGDLERDPDLIRGAMRVLLKHRETWVELGEKLIAAPAGSAAMPTSSAVPAPHGRSWEG
jgi:flagellar protein FliS